MTCNARETETSTGHNTTVYLEPRFHFSRSNKLVFYCFVECYANELSTVASLWKGY